MALEKRNGGKFSGNHTTLTDLAAVLADVAVKLPSVRRISPGFISAGQGTGKGERRVKFLDKNGGVLLVIRQSHTIQDLWIITDDRQETKLAIARAARDMNVAISFQKPS